MRDWAIRFDGMVGLNIGIDIIGAFKKSLKKLEWMDEESAAAAAGKVRLLL